ncbi:MAG: hypothetical protein ACYC67_24000 [Prosthecobacter sp.]
MTTTLNHIAEQAVAFTADDPDGGLWLQHILQLLDTKGTENEHLANPLNRDPKVFYVRPRDKALTGAEVIHGDFLALDYCGHTPSMTLLDYPRIEELEAAILGGGGILNLFTTYLLAFREGRIAPYDVFYDSPSGERVRFNKRHQDQDKEAAKTVYPNPEIRWL